MIRFINKFGRVLDSLRIRSISLDEERLLEISMKNTGLSDFGDESFREGLSRFVAAVEEESSINLIGRSIAKRVLIQNLENRLRIEDHLKKKPHILMEKIERPLFIVGLPRTGTTILQALLEVDPIHRSPLSWECMKPYPPPSAENYRTDPRIAEVQKLQNRFFELFPEVKKAHLMTATTPQECLAIHRLEMKSMQFFAQFRGYAYQDWLDNLDQVPVFKAHKRMLKYLQSGGVGGRWLLKTPYYLSFIKEILTVYPDAMIICTHRDPFSAVPSIASVMYHLYKPSAKSVDPIKEGTFQTEWWAKQMDCFLKQRKELGDLENVYDLHFSDFIQDPLGSVEQIYAHFDFEFTSDLKTQMQEFMISHPRHKDGKHSYEASFYGIEKGYVRKRFSEYIDHFQIAIND